MKHLSKLLLLLLVIRGNAQELKEIKVESEIDEVTVFLNSAQVHRKKVVELISGVSIIKFIGLSSFIDAKSIQVKAEGEVMVLAVNHQRNFLKKMEKR